MIKKQRQDITDYLNDRTYIEELKAFKNLANNLFKWNGLPDTVPIDFVDDRLFAHGLLAYYDDPNLGPLILEATPTKEYNVYNRATSYNLKGFNYSKMIDVEELVLIRNTLMSEPTYPMLESYAERIADIQRTIDVLLVAHKMPWIVSGDATIIASLKLAFKKIVKNEPFLAVDKSLNPDNLKVLLAETDYIIDKLNDYKQSLRNEVKTYLGIDNLNLDKKERNTVDEVNANNEEISLNLDILLSARKDSCKELSKVLGHTVTCELKHKPTTQENETQDEDEEDIENE